MRRYRKVSLRSTYGCKSLGGCFFWFFCPASECLPNPGVAGMWLGVISCSCCGATAESYDNEAPLSSKSYSIGDVGMCKALSSSTMGMVECWISYCSCRLYMCWLESVRLQIIKYEKRGCRKFGFSFRQLCLVDCLCCGVVSCDSRSCFVKFVRVWVKGDFVLNVPKNDFVISNKVDEVIEATKVFFRRWVSL